MVLPFWEVVFTWMVLAPTARLTSKSSVEVSASVSATPVPSKYSTVMLAPTGLGFTVIVAAWLGTSVV